MDPQELEKELKSYATELIDSVPDKFTNLLINVDLNDVFFTLLNTWEEGEPSIKISYFEISKLVQIIELKDKYDIYRTSRIEHITDIISEEVPSITVKEVKGAVPIILSMAYEFEIDELSRIKIKGSGEVKIHRKNGEYLIEAENEFDIEAVMEIEGKQENILIEYGKAVIKGLIKIFITLYLGKFLNI